MDVDSIRVLLSFALAHGNVAHSVEVIMNLLSMLLGGVVRVTRGCGHGTWQCGT